MLRLKAMAHEPSALPLWACHNYNYHACCICCNYSPLCGKKSTTWASAATKVGPTLNLDMKNMSSIVATWPPKWQQLHLTNLSSCARPLALLGHDLRDQVLGDGHLHEIKHQDEDAKVQCAKGYRRNTLKVPTLTSISISNIKIASPHIALKFV